MTTHNEHEHDDHEREDGDNVVWLPASRDDGVVLNGELVPDTDREMTAARVREAFNTRRLVPEAARERMADGAVELSRRAAPAAMTGGKAVLRHGAYVLAGAGVVAKRVRDAHTNSRYERVMRRAEAEGDLDRLGEWEQRAEQAKDRRHGRAMDWLDAPMKLVKALAVGALSLVVVLLTIGIVLAVDADDIGMVLQPLAGAVDTIRWTWWFAAVYGALVLCGLTAALVAYLWQQGRARADTPAWLTPPERAARPDTVVDESLVMTALRTLGHAGLNKRIKDGWGTSVVPTWIQPPMPHGKGWEFALRLPHGVPVADIAKRKTAFAHNLGRAPSEVWIDSDDNDASAMRAFVLDPGALREPVPDYPLLTSGEADFWTGFPVGIDARWNPVVTPVFERNFVAAGVMGSGKSTLLVALLAGAALDPLVDIDIFCFAENNDYRWLEPVAATISMGNTPENVQACQAHIDALQLDLEKRGRLLGQLGLDSVTRAAATKHPQLRPRMVVVDECQSFFRRDAPEDRRAVVNSMVRFYSAARKYGVVLLFATPTPSDQSLPRDLVAITTNRACFAINDRARNNVVLGERAFESGLSALDLKPRTSTALNDVGTSVTVGFMDRDGLLRSYHLNSEQREQIVARAVELRGGSIHHVAEPEQQPATETLDDIAHMLTKAGARRMRTQEVLQRLAEHNPARYRDWTFSHLTEYLADTPAAVYTSDGNRVVAANRIQEAITQRDRKAEGGDQ